MRKSIAICIVLLLVIGMIAATTSIVFASTPADVAKTPSIIRDAPAILERAKVVGLAIAILIALIAIAGLARRIYYNANFGHPGTGQHYLTSTGPPGDRDESVIQFPIDRRSHGRPNDLYSPARSSPA